MLSLTRFCVLYKLGVIILYETTSLAEMIKKRAKEIKIPLNQIFKQASLSNEVIANLKKGSMLKADNLARIADALSCSVDYLLGRVDNPDWTPRDQAKQEELTGEEIAALRQLITKNDHQE